MVTAVTARRGEVRLGWLAGWERRRLRAGGASLLAVALAACAGGAAVTTTSTATTVPATTATTAATTTVPEPVLTEVELAGFQPRTVTFTNVEFTVTRAVVSNQDPRSYAEGGDPVVDEEAFYAYLDVTATNLMASTMAGFEEGNYGLEVGGTVVPAIAEVSFLSELSGFIQPNSAVDSFLAFAVPMDTDLAGAVLVIGTPPDRTTSLPLTGDVPDPSFPVEVAASGSAQGIGPTNQGTIEFTVLGAVLSEDSPHEKSTSPTGLRADEGELFLVVQVRAEVLSGPGRELIGTDAFRLFVDGTPRSPWDVADDPAGSDASPSVDPGAAVDAWVAFMVPTDATELVLEVGDFESSPGQIAIELPDLG